MTNREIAEIVRARIVQELQQPDVREIIHRHMRAALLTGVPADPVVVAQEINEYVKARITAEEP